MNPEAEQLLKANPFAWAAWERSHNIKYWTERAQNGSGLIQQIAVFVLDDKEGEDKQRGR